MSFFKDLTEKIIPTRIRVKLKSRRVNPVLPVSLISADRETDSNAPTNVSTVVRAINDAAQAILPVVATVVAPVPIAGPPLAAAISGLVAILKGIDTYEQNTRDLAALQSRLHRLYIHLCNAPTTSDPGQQMWRNSLASDLQETSDELTKLDKHCAMYTIRVTQAITGCSNRIKEYLDEYMLSSQMRMEHELHATFAVVQSMQGHMTRISGVVTLVDATGCEHPILMDYCASFQQFKKMLEAIFECNSIQAEIQKLFLATGEYNLCIDHGNETTQLTSDNWVSPLEAGTKVVMGLVVKQRRRAFIAARSHLCHFCRTRNSFVNVDEQKIVSMHCKGCKRRFQVSITNLEGKLEQRTSSARKEIKRGKIFHDYTPEAKMRLIQNFHVKHEEEPLSVCELLKYLRISHGAMAMFRSQERSRLVLLVEKRERVEHIEVMSRFETVESEDDESEDDDSFSNAESWSGQEQEKRHRDDQDGHHRIPC